MDKNKFEKLFRSFKERYNLHMLAVEKYKEISIKHQIEKANIRQVARKQIEDELKKIKVSNLIINDTIVIQSTLDSLMGGNENPISIKANIEQSETIKDLTDNLYRKLDEIDQEIKDEMVSSQEYIDFISHQDSCEFKQLDLMAEPFYQYSLLQWTEHVIFKEYSDLLRNTDERLRVNYEGAEWELINITHNCIGMGLDEIKVEIKRPIKNIRRILNSSCLLDMTII